MTAGPHVGDYRDVEGDPQLVEVWTGETWLRLVPVEPAVRIKQLEAEVAQLKERWRTRHFD